jgi:hypothetical protein
MTNWLLIGGIHVFQRYVVLTVILQKKDFMFNIVFHITVLCDNLLAIDGGSYSYSTDGETTQVTYECDEGYSLSGSSSATCSSLGSWSKSQPKCGM